MEVYPLENCVFVVALLRKNVYTAFATLTTIEEAKEKIHQIFVGADGIKIILAVEPKSDPSTWPRVFQIKDDMFTLITPVYSIYQGIGEDWDY